jgi:acyl-CoA synthetase (AMP-forming)/AMP-acid ligase II
MLPPLLHALEQQAAQRPTERAFADDREQVTWAEFAERVRHCAVALEALGLEPGERIGLHALNSIELAVTMLACWRRRLVTVLLSPASKGPELAQELSATGAAAYLADPDLYPVGEPVLGRCPTMRLALLLKRGAVTPEVVARFSSEGQPVAEMPEPSPDLAVIMFSSGTTGIPKGVMHTHASLAAMGGPSNDVKTPGHILSLIVVPLVYNLMALSYSLRHDCTLVLLRRPEPESLLDALAAHRCQVVWFLMPALGQRVLEAQQARRRDTSSCFAWYVFGDAVPKHLLDAWPRHFGQPLCQAYGMTESSGGFRNEPPWDRPGSVGLPFPGTQIRLVNEAGHECAVGEAGELLLRGPAMCAGYWNDPQTTAAVMGDGWFRTGDLAQRDADGYYWFRGRIKQIIACDGEKISPQHVESALLEHPDVLEAGVVGRPSELHGEVPVAFVRLRPGATAGAAALREFVAARVEACGVPEGISFVESLPRGRTGKVDRRKLRRQLAKVPTF